MKSYLKHPRWKALSTLGLSALLLGLGTPSLLHADNMRSDSYIIQFGNLNMTAGEKSGGGYKVTDTVGQTAPGEYTSTGYKILAGFQYVYAIPHFSFRITDLSIDLGLLTPEVFSQDSHDLVVTTRSGGYALYVRATHPLKMSETTSNTEIPFTTCNAGCTTTSAGLWDNALSPGWGIHAAGTHAATDFSNTNFFRPLADAQAAQNAAIIASHNKVVRDDAVTVTYKAAISGAQAAGNYATAVEFTAVPTY